MIWQKTTFVLNSNHASKDYDLIAPDTSTESASLRKPRRESVVVLVIALMTGALGLAHALVTPTWANVEEAGHYEHVRLRAELGRAPTFDDRNDALFDEIHESRVWMHHSIGEAGIMRNALLTGDWADLRADLLGRPGYSDAGSRNTQLREPVAYYWMAAVALRGVLGQPLETQILVLRLVSIGIGMVTVWVAYLAAREYLPDDGRGRLVLPALIGVHSSFVVIASSVGNTVMAVLAVTVAVYVALRVVRRGLTWMNGGLMAAGIVLCLISKPTALPGVGVIVFAPMLTLPDVWMRRVWVGVGIGGVLGVLFGCTWQRPVAWYPDTPVTWDADRMVPHGRYALAIGEDGDRWQSITAEQAQMAAGEWLTVGFWTDQAAADEGVQLWLAGDQEQVEMIPPEAVSSGATEDGWTYQTQVYAVPDSAQCVTLRVGTAGPAAYDGIVMVPGDYGDADPPTLLDRRGGQLVWAGDTLRNFVRNGSGEGGGPMPRPALTEVLPERLADSSLALYGRWMNFVDWRGNGAQIGQSARWLFSSFWSRFSWTVPGYPRGVIAGLALLYVLGIAGMMRFVVRQGGLSAWQVRATAVMGLALVLIWSLAILRIDPPSLSRLCDRYQGRFISTGYYIVPGVLPMLSVLYMGLREWVGTRGRRWLGGLLVLGLFGLSAASLVGRQIPAFLHFYGIEVDPGWWTILW